MRRIQKQILKRGAQRAQGMRKVRKAISEFILSKFILCALCGSLRSLRSPLFLKSQEAAKAAVRSLYNYLFSYRTLHMPTPHPAMRSDE